jgi:uncharacterized protein (DUF302 family)
MESINFKKEVTSSVEDAIGRISELLKSEGFGMLTRIDFHSKIKEKLNKDIPETVVLGACNPKLAFEAYQKNSDFTSLIPCNVVVRDIGKGRVSIEIVKPTSMMKALGDSELENFAKDADAQLKRALDSF